MESADRTTGCLLGLAVGDALGAPVSFMTANQIQIKLGTDREMSGGGWLLLRPGEFAEGTKLAVLLGRSLVEHGRLDVDDVAARYVEYYRTGPKELTGVLRTALSLLAEGTPAEEAARKAHDLTGEDAGGNGSLTRAVPLALFYGSRRDELIDAVAAEARITHRDERAVAGSVATAVILSLLLEGTEKAEVFDAAWDLLEENTHGIPNILPDVPSKTEWDLRPTARATDTLEVAIWHFLTGRDFEETLVRTANLGGDADTTTALAGAFAGASYGRDAIPKRWLRALADRTVIRDLARKLGEGATP